MTHTYDYPRPAVTVDCVVFGLDESGLQVLLVQRDLEPFSGQWALPGGFVDMNESLDDAARRELEEETGLRGVFLEQLFTFGQPGRDPRGRVISIAYFALVNLRDHEVQAATDARSAAWFALDDTPPLAFDHAHILEIAHTRLRGKVRYQPIGFELLPEAFTLFELQRLYEIVLDRELDKRNFRRKILSLGIVEDTGEIQKDVAHRAARLYRFNRVQYQELQASGADFEI